MVQGVIEGVKFARKGFVFSGSKVDRTFSFSKLDRHFGQVSLGSAGLISLPPFDSSFALSPEMMQRREGKSPEEHIVSITALINKAAEAMAVALVERKRRMEARSRKIRLTNLKYEKNEREQPGALLRDVRRFEGDPYQDAPHGVARSPISTGSNY